MAHDSTTGRPPPQDRWLHYGWVIVAGCFLTWFMVGAVQTFTLFIAPWQEQFGWSIAVISLAASVQLVVNGLFGPFAGRLADQYGTRPVLLGYVALLGLGALALSEINSLWQLVVVYGVVFGATSALSPVLSPMIARWFRRGRGLAFAVAPGGHHLGRGAFAPVVVALMALGDWRTPWLFMGAAILLLLGPFLFFTFRRPPDEGSAETPGAGQRADRAGQQSRGAPVRAAVRTRTFWMVFLGFMVCGSTAQPITIHLAPIAMEGNLGQAEAAGALAVFGFLSLAGLLTSGVTTERLGARGTLVAYYLARGAGFVVLVLFLSTGHPALLYVGSGIVAFFSRGTDPAVRSILVNCYGVGSLGSLVGLVLLIHQLASALWIFLGGLIFEVTGTYTVYLLASGILLVGAVVVSWQIRQSAYYPQEA